MDFKQLFLQQILATFCNSENTGLSAKTKAQVNSLAEYLLRPTITPKNLGLTYATIKYWESKGYLILSTPKEADEWRKYSVIEYLWFQLLKKIVNMGCNLDKVATHLVFAYANYKTPDSQLSFNDPAPPLIVIDGIKLNAFIGFLNHIIFITLTRSSATIQFHQQGCSFYCQKGNDKAQIVNKMHEFAFTTGINLCVSDILLFHILGISGDGQRKFAIFTKAESEVLSLLRKKEIQEITVKQNDGKIYQVEAVEKADTMELLKPLNSFITGDYQELTFTTNNNKSISFKRKTKQKF